MRKSHNFRELKVWMRSRALVKEVYKLSKKFPKEEIFGLTQQMRRCAVSIPSNIAEGCGRGTNPQIVHFLDIAHGSACELETQLYLSIDLAYVLDNEVNKLMQELNEIQKMILGFRATLE
ncbi:MAG: four helix bundle protein [Bacteroidetes bacterium]|nr:four helix bundle protein [Bacteroidota bacterium]